MGEKVGHELKLEQLNYTNDYGIHNSVKSVTINSKNQLLS